MTKKPKLLALASGGGHWTQLMRLRPAFAAFDTVYVSMFESYAEQVSDDRFYTIPDASRFNVRAFAPVMMSAARILMRERPAAVVTTGSAPMLAFILLSRMIGARTLWIDSIANSEKMSASGRLARKLAHQVITQWPDVAEGEHVECWGRIL